MYGQLELEGTWEEIAARASEFAGRRVRLTVFPETMRPADINGTGLTIEEKIQQTAAQIPEGDWAKLPTHLSGTLDPVRDATGIPKLLSLERKLMDAAAELEVLYAEEDKGDEDVDKQLRTWLNGSPVLDWQCVDRVTPDEWFFISTLYGEMTLEGQRTHIRKYFPSLFVTAASRDIRNFVPNMPDYIGLRSGWMSRRLSKMSEILRGRGQTMSEYTEGLRSLEASASASDPMPALDRIILDHGATGWKTLSVFIRDCVRGNCFPIDSRVAKELNRHGLPSEERELVSLCLACGLKPRRVARMFYAAGGERQ